MGWWPFAEEQPKVIRQEERQQCWRARDVFFDCLDQHKILDPRYDKKATRKACPQEIQDFENMCIPAWTDYFAQKRVANVAKELRIRKLEAEGYQAIDRPLNELPRRKD